MGATSDKIKGKAKATEGRATGDRVRETQGKAQQIKGEVEAAASRAKSRVRAKVDELKAKRAAKQRSRSR